MTVCLEIRFCRLINANHEQIIIKYGSRADANATAVVFYGFDANSPIIICNKGVALEAMLLKIVLILIRRN